MIVYGDAVREEPLDQALANARSEIDRALHHDLPIDLLRRVLIHLGEIEQALSDGSAADYGSHESERSVASREATDAAADAFERLVEEIPERDTRAARRAREDLLRARRALAHLHPPGAVARVHVPEGFAFYGLLPESYRSTAHRWAGEHEGEADRDVLVAGVRSIGTSLSAVVAAALRSRGFRVRRITLRPEGHPFARHVHGQVPVAPRGIVVDEGPGLSGSSMLAVVDLLQRSGVDVVDLFPAHGSGPGFAASAGARRRWRSLRSYVKDTTRETGGSDLASRLWGGIDALRFDEPATYEDLGGGSWRARLIEDPSLWPASPRALERPKLLVTGRSGLRVLFKFSGLATSSRGRGSMADALARRLAALARGGWTAAPLGVAMGFIALHWIEGDPCSAGDASMDVAEHLAAYVAASARGPLAPREAEAAGVRLLDMVRVNTREALGEDASRAAVDLVESSGTSVPWIPAAGDGRMAPHEWIRANDGELVKADAGGHEVDHTWVGRQPVAWDLAGTLLEWNLHGTLAERFLAVFEEHSGLQVRHLVGSYRIAYAAHRAGQSRLFADSEQDSLERSIQERAFGRWRSELQRILADRDEHRGMVA
jgi:hypothetical protein